MATSLEHYMNYNFIPLSKRIEKNIKQEKRDLNYEIRGRDINWRSGMNTLDPETGFSPLMIAIIQGKKDLVVALIERGANIEQKDSKKGRTPLMLAAHEGHVPILKELIKRDALINASDNSQKTALMYAAKAGYEDCITILLNHGAGVNMIDENGYTALHYASKFGYPEIVKSLIQAAASIESRDNNDGFAPIHFAALYNRKETLLVLISYEARINRRSIKEKVTALMLAAREGNKTIVNVLIDKGADVNLIDIHGWTALHFACSWGRHDTSHILIVKGQAYINVRDPTREGVGGTTPLVIASKGGHIPVIKLLLHYGADINLPEMALGQNPLSAAAELGNSKTLEVLLDYSANINYQNPFTGATAIISAIKAGKRGAIITLLNHNADLNIIDYDYRTAFEYALEYKTLDTLLSAIIHCTSNAKTNLIPWIELYTQQINPLILKSLTTSSEISSPSTFLNAFLYSNEGAYYGLYNTTRDRDVYLIFSLMMILIACHSSYRSYGSHSDLPLLPTTAPKSPDLLDKVAVIEDMIVTILRNTREIVDEYRFTDSLILGSFPLKQLLGDRCLYDYKYLVSGFFYGPIALYLENDLMTLLEQPMIRERMIDPCFVTSIKSPNYIIDGYGIQSNYLLFRYFPYKMFLLEGASNVLFLVLIVLYCVTVPASYFSANGETSIPLTFGMSSSLEIILIIMSISFLGYQIGLLEEKRWMITSSLIFDYPQLEKKRYQKLWQHYLPSNSPWYFLDGLTMGLTISWFIIRIVASHSYSAADTSSDYYQMMANQLLLLAIIPLSLGLVRYCTAFSLTLDVEILTIVLSAIDVFQMFFWIFLIMILSFGMVFYTTYHTHLAHEFSSYDTSIQTMFNAIILNFDAQMFHHHVSPANQSFGIVLLLVFLILTIFILFNSLIGRITSNYRFNMNKAKQWSSQIKARHIQQYSPFLEKSALCMLPPPFTLLMMAIYPFHIYQIWRSRLVIKQRICISLGGTSADYVLGLFFLIPSAVYEYWVVDIKGKHIGYLNALLFGAFRVGYICLCLLYKMMKEPTVKVILKTKISDGRVRVSYSFKQDLLIEGEKSLSNVEDLRLYKDLQGFNSQSYETLFPYNPKVQSLQHPLYHHPEQLAVQRSKQRASVPLPRNDGVTPTAAAAAAAAGGVSSVIPVNGEEHKDELSRMISKGERGKGGLQITSPVSSLVLREKGDNDDGDDRDEVMSEDVREKSLWDTVWNNFFQKRDNLDSVGRKIRIQPYALSENYSPHRGGGGGGNNNNGEHDPHIPYLQLNNLTEEEVYDLLPHIGSKLKPQYQQGQAYYQESKIISEEIMRIKQFNQQYRKGLINKRLLLAEDIHSQYHASMLPNLSQDGVDLPATDLPPQEKEEETARADTFQTMFRTNTEKPTVKWSINTKETASQSMQEERIVKVVNPYQFGISKKSQWDELAQEVESSYGVDPNIAITLTTSPAKPTQALANTLPDDIEVPSFVLNKEQNVIDKNLASPRQSSPKQHQQQKQAVPARLTETMISPRKKQYLHTPLPEQKKIIASSNYLHHHNNDYFSIDQQGLNNFTALNHPSLYFHLQLFPPMFYENERKEIFTKVLKELFIDDFAYSIESNEKYLISLNQTISGLQKQNTEQIKTIHQLLDKLHTLEEKATNGMVWSRPASPYGGVYDENAVYLDSPQGYYAQENYNGDYNNNNEYNNNEYYLQATGNTQEEGGEQQPLPTY